MRVIAMLLMAFLAFACAPKSDSMEAAKAAPSPIEQGKWVVDVIFKGEQCQTVKFGNFEPKTLCYDDYVFMGWQEVPTNKRLTLARAAKYIEQPAKGYELIEIRHIRAKPKYQEEDSEDLPNDVEPPVGE